MHRRPHTVPGVKEEPQEFTDSAAAQHASLTGAQPHMAAAGELCRHDSYERLRRQWPLYIAEWERRGHFEHNRDDAVPEREQELVEHQQPSPPIRVPPAHKPRVSMNALHWHRRNRDKPTQAPPVPFRKKQQGMTRIINMRPNGFTQCRSLLWLSSKAHRDGPHNSQELGHNDVGLVESLVKQHMCMKAS